MQNALTFDSKYDFSRFDTRVQSEVKPAKKEKAKAKEVAPAKAKSIISGFGLMSWILCMALLFANVYANMALTEAAGRVSSLENDNEALMEEIQMLEIKKEQKYGSQQLQEIAVNQLGMQKIQKEQITYVSTKTGDYTEVAKSTTMRSEDSTILAGIANGFNSVIEYLN